MLTGLENPEKNYNDAFSRLPDRCMHHFLQSSCDRPIPQDLDGVLSMLGVEPLWDVNLQTLGEEHPILDHHFVIGGVGTRHSYKRKNRRYPSNIVS